MPSTTPLTGFCFKCQANKAILHAQTITMKNGKPAVRGDCATCGRTIYRLGGTKKRAA